MGKASPNHNLTKHTLELAGQGVIHLLRAIKHGGKASELAPVCVWPRRGYRLESGPLAVLLVLSGSSGRCWACVPHLAHSEGAPAWQFIRTNPHPDSVGSWVPS